MWRNNGDSTFTDVTDSAGLGGEGPSFAAVGTDYNNDRAIDIVVTGKDSPTIFQNPREGKFRARHPWSTPVPSPTLGVAVADLNHDGWMDVVFTNWGTGLTLWKNDHGKSFDRS